MSSIIDFKVAIFDLDLTLWDYTKLYDEAIDILTTLKSLGVKMYIASYNSEAKQVCEILNISDFFKTIYGRDKQPHMSKLDMVEAIMTENKLPLNSYIFLDDNIDYIREISVECGIRCRHIKYGISWSQIINEPGELFEFIIGPANPIATNIVKA